MTAARATSRLKSTLELPVLPPVAALGGPTVRLFLTSATLLFVELLLIRWIPANVTYVGFFRNFLLMASFLGIGAGILYGRDPKASRLSLFPLLLFAIVVLRLIDPPNVIDVAIPGLDLDTSRKVAGVGAALAAVAVGFGGYVQERERLLAARG